jgi:hypothetical protein
MFKPLRYDAGMITTIKDGTASSTTITKFDALDWSSGYLQRATSGTTIVRYVAMEDKTTAAAAHEDIQVLFVAGVEFECDTAGSTSAAIRGTFLDLTDHDTINEAASSTNVFLCTEMIGAAADKKVRGYFMENVA